MTSPHGTSATSRSDRLMSAYGQLGRHLLKLSSIAAREADSMLELFKRQTRDDPRFGLLVYRPAGWVGKLSLPLFPAVDVAISIRTQDESEFAVVRRHLEQVIAHCESIRSEIASEALETCQSIKPKSAGRSIWI